MELVPIITQILLIVAVVFIIVLLVSYIASKVRKKNQTTAPNYKIQQVQSYPVNKNSVVKNRFYSESYYNNDSLSSYPKEIRVVRRAGVSGTPSPDRRSSSGNLRTTPAHTNSRFTVINNISSNEPRKIETDEYGFKLYTDNEITRSVYLPS